MKPGHGDSKNPDVKVGVEVDKKDETPIISFISGKKANTTVDMPNIIPQREPTEAVVASKESKWTCHYVMTLLASIFCFGPLSIIGLTHFMAAKTHQKAGNMVEARKRKHQAKCWSLCSFLVGVAIIIALVVTIVSVVRIYSREYESDFDYEQPSWERQINEFSTTTEKWESYTTTERDVEPTTNSKYTTDYVDWNNTPEPWDYEEDDQKSYTTTQIITTTTDESAETSPSQIRTFSFIRLIFPSSTQQPSSRISSPSFVRPPSRQPATPFPLPFPLPQQQFTTQPQPFNPYMRPFNPYPRRRLSMPRRPRFFPRRQFTPIPPQFRRFPTPFPQQFRPYPTPFPQQFRPYLRPSPPRRTINPLTLRFLMSLYSTTTPTMIWTNPRFEPQTSTTMPPITTDFDYEIEEASTTTPMPEIETTTTSTTTTPSLISTTENLVDEIIEEDRAVLSDNWQQQEELAEELETTNNTDAIINIESQLDNLADQNAEIEQEIDELESAPSSTTNPFTTTAQEEFTTEQGNSTDEPFSTTEWFTTTTSDGIELLEVGNFTDGNETVVEEAIIDRRTGDFLGEVTEVLPAETPATEIDEFIPSSTTEFTPTTTDTIEVVEQEVNIGNKTVVEDIAFDEKTGEIFNEVTEVLPAETPATETDEFIPSSTTEFTPTTSDPVEIVEQEVNIGNETVVEEMAVDEKTGEILDEVTEVLPAETPATEFDEFIPSSTTGFWLEEVANDTITTMDPFIGEENFNTTTSSTTSTSTTTTESLLNVEEQAVEQEIINAEMNNPGAQAAPIIEEMENFAREPVAMP